MYKEMKVFEGHSYGGFTFVCTCEGVAREMGYGNVTPSRLLYNKQHESEIEDGILVYQGIIEMTGERTSWFLTRDRRMRQRKGFLASRHIMLIMPHWTQRRLPLSSSL